MSTPRPRSRKPSPGRRGAMYFFALFLALLMSALLLGLSAVSASQRHALRAGSRSDGALRAARAGIEHALTIAAGDASWRTSRPNGTWLSDVALGDARYTVRVVDEGDGSLSDDPEEDVVITSTGTVEDAIRTVRVRARPVAIDALSTALTASTRIELHDSTTVSSGGLYSNGDIRCKSDATIDGDLFAVGPIDLGGAQLNGSAVSPVAPREMPRADVIAVYMALATPLTPPLDKDKRKLERVIVSPTSNPYGVPNPQTGIYLIDCQGVNLEIRNCRIEATLIVVNMEKEVRLRRGILWRPAFSHLPAMLVQGNLKIGSASTINESTVGRSLNPPGLPVPPYPRGSLPDTQTDNDSFDVYLSVIEGLVYVEGDKIDDEPNAVFRLHGTLIHRGTRTKVNSDSVLRLNAAPWLAEHPPLGFRSHRLRAVPGTWRLVMPGS